MNGNSYHAVMQWKGFITFEINTSQRLGRKY